MDWVCFGAAREERQGAIFGRSAAQAEEARGGRRVGSGRGGARAARARPLRRQPPLLLPVLQRAHEPRVRLDARAFPAHQVERGRTPSRTTCGMCRTSRRSPPPPPTVTRPADRQPVSTSVYALEGAVVGVADGYGDVPVVSARARSPRVEAGRRSTAPPPSSAASSPPSTSPVYPAYSSRA